jgi:hypothetical protein
MLILIALPGWSQGAEHVRSARAMLSDQWLMLTIKTISGRKAKPDLMIFKLE